MSRLQILILVWFTGVFPAFSQTPLDLELLETNWSAPLEAEMIKAARSDGDSSKVFIIRSIHALTAIGIRNYPEAERILLSEIRNLESYPGNYKKRDRKSTRLNSSH